MGKMIRVIDSVDQEPSASDHAVCFPKNRCQGRRRNVFKDDVGGMNVHRISVER